jgi:small subunit ribosomal protein S17
MHEQKVKILTGLVTSKSGDKSIKVAVDRLVKHAKYGKYVRDKTMLGVHDEHNQAGVGDLVDICECRPYSKTKSWRLVRLVQKASKE